MDTGLITQTRGHVSGELGTACHASTSFCLFPRNGSAKVSETLNRNSELNGRRLGNS